MQVYRFQWLDSDGRIVRTLDLNLHDDVSALESAEQRCQDYPIDIYQANRFVAHIKQANAALDTLDKSSL